MHGCSLWGGCAWFYLRGACVVLFWGHVWFYLGGMHGYIRGGHACFYSGGACKVLFGRHAWFYSGGHAWFFQFFSDTMRYGQWAGGTHPTGMHTCFYLVTHIVPKCVAFLHQFEHEFHFQTNLCSQIKTCLVVPSLEFQFGSVLILMGTVIGRMGCIPILPIITVTVTESLGVNES